MPNLSQAQTAAPLPRPDSPSDTDAARFLEQGTFGPTPADIAHIKQVGLRGWLNEQFALPISDYNNLLYTENSPSYYARKRFFENAIKGNDQLRQRVVFALQQFIVASVANGFQNSDKQPAIANFTDVLDRNAFGNFRQLMYEVATSPTMGQFLNMVNNDKANPAINSAANENFAREMMQLFTLGVYLLNPDGSLQLDSNGQPIYTYSSADIRAFARVNTGWTYPTMPGATLKIHNPAYFVGPMVPYTANHDTTAKTLLNGTTLPANQTPEQDLNGSMDNLFNHPNIAPFVSRRLIQHLVTSNPSPGYIQRVASVFINNGQGVRGDMKSVIAAILLDGEAVGGIGQNPYFGHQREPALLITNAIKPFFVSGDLYGLPDVSNTLTQNIFNSATVFNFYGPDYLLFTTDANNNPVSFYSPESQLLTTNTALARPNFINTLVYGTIYVPTNLGPPPSGATPAGSTSAVLDFTPFNQYAATPSVLVDKLGKTLLHGPVPSGMASAIVTAVNTYPAATPINRVKAAAYLILTSQQFQNEGSTTKVQTINSNVVLTGSVSPSQPLQFVFRPDNGDTTFLRLATPDASGNVVLPYIPPGAYHIAVKGSKWLQKVVTADTTGGDVSGLNVNLTPGDINNDNVVDIADFGLLVNAYGSDSKVPGSSYNVNADLNSDGVVDINDFGLLVNSYGMMGDL